MSFAPRARSRLGAFAAVTVVAVVAGFGFAHRSSAAVTATGVVNITTNLAYQNGAAAGTGMVITRSGRVLTNNHVIRGATTIRVTDPTSNRTWNATVVGYSVSGDVALLQLRSARNLRTVTLGDSSTVRLGQGVTALGNAGGAGGAPARSTGRVTGLNQAITVSDHEGGSRARLTNLIRIDASLEPGDSGGPLFDSAGRVIGMDTAASVGFQFETSNEGYAIPINRALAVVRQITTSTSSATVHVGATPFLGVSLTSYRQGLGSGPVVAGIATGTPAARAGIATGSLITRIDGRAVSSPDDVQAAILRHRAGEIVTVRWIDPDGAIHSVGIKTIAGPPQ
jgi:S1-C subfamily serine protease